MLVGIRNSIRITAWDAEKGHIYFCPNCEQLLVLKKGRRVIHHFAHKPPVSCDWARGETHEHMQAKRLLAHKFAEQGFLAEVEVPVISTGGDRRADILLTDKAGRRAAVEVQHSPLSEEAIERRTMAYIDSDVPVAWIGLLDKKLKADLEPSTMGWKVRKFAPRPWQRWAHAYGFKQLWFVDPDNGDIWSGHMEPHMIEVPTTSWYSQEGEEQSAGGYTRYSKKWKILRLSGPFSPSEVIVTTPYRKAWSSPKMKLPSGRFLKLSPPN